MASETFTAHQAVCNECDWSSIRHLDKKHAAEDAAVHSDFGGHHVVRLVTYKVQGGSNGD